MMPPLADDDHLRPEPIKCAASGERTNAPLDAIVIVSFGGPEGPEEVRPFLARVTAGRAVPAARLAEVAERYLMFGGVSPLNHQNRLLVAALRDRLATNGPNLPVYLGNRNAAPFIVDAVAEMTADGVAGALAFVTSPYSSYSGCRQYREELAAACAEVGPTAPHIRKLRPFFDHPGFVAPFIDGVRAALQELGPDAALIGTAHSLPRAMASTCDYEPQLRTVLDLVARGADHAGPVSLAWQSRSGAPSVPWLEPDIGAELRRLAALGTTDVVVAPIGFTSDHFEVVWDLDRVAAGVAADLGMNWRRVATPGTDGRTVEMIRQLVLEHTEGTAPMGLADPEKRRLGHADCCPPPLRR